MTGAHLAPLAVLALMALPVRSRLLTSGYSSGAALGITACFLSLTSLCLFSANGLTALLLGCGVYAVCASTFSLARERSVRGIIRAGCALAGAQIVVPFGGLFISMLLPALIGLPRSQNELRKFLGVLLLLLFIPSIAATVLMVTHFRFDCGAPIYSSFILSAAILVLFPTLAATGFRSRHWTSLIPPLTGSALLVAMVAGNAVGEARSPRELAPALSSMILIAICEWPAAPHRSRWAFLLFGAAIASTWTAFEAGLL